MPGGCTPAVLRGFGQVSYPLWAWAPWSKLTITASPLPPGDTDGCSASRQSPPWPCSTRLLSGPPHTPRTVLHLTSFLSLPWGWQGQRGVAMSSRCGLYHGRCSDLELVLGGSASYRAFSTLPPPWSPHVLTAASPLSSSQAWGCCQGRARDLCPPACPFLARPQSGGGCVSGEPYPQGLGKRGSQELHEGS